MSNLYISRIGAYFCCSQIGRPILGIYKYINECRNWEQDRALSFLGIYKSGFSVQCGIYLQMEEGDWWMVTQLLDTHLLLYQVSTYYQFGLHNRWEVFSSWLIYYARVYVAPCPFIPPNFFYQSRLQDSVEIYSALYINPDCNLLGSFELLLITIYSRRYLFRQVSTATQKCMKKYEKTSDYSFSQLRISSTMFF